MGVSKIFSGLNQNAQRFLLPHWMSAYSGAVMRLGFGSLFFWVYGFFKKDKTSTGRTSVKDAVSLLLIGMICVFGYMFFLLKGLTYTTPVSSSIFLSLEPVCVYVICLVIGTERFSSGRVAGILIGIIGAVIIVLSEHAGGRASNPLLGDMFCFGSAFLYSLYLVFEKRYLKRLSNATVSKWTFTGGLITAAIVVAVTGWDAPVLSQGIFSAPFLVLAFVLVFPTAVSYLLVDMGLKLLPATVVALYGNVILVVSAVAGYILGQDKFSWWQVLSIAMMTASMYLVESDEQKKSASALNTSTTKSVK